jgi:hypothetical protein
MSGNSSLSAAKRRRGGSQPVQTSDSGKGPNVQQSKPPPKIPHPLEILKDHELRIRYLETGVKELTQKLTIAETSNASLSAQNKNILKQLQIIKSNINKSKLDGTEEVTKIEPTFSKLDIEGTISEGHSDSESSNE